MTTVRRERSGVRRSPPTTRSADGRTHHSRGVSPAFSRASLGSICSSFVPESGPGRRSALLARHTRDRALGTGHLDLNWDGGFADGRASFHQFFRINHLD